MVNVILKMKYIGFDSMSGSSLKEHHQAMKLIVLGIDCNNVRHIFLTMYDLMLSYEDITSCDHFHEETFCLGIINKASSFSAVNCQFMRFLGGYKLPHNMASRKTKIRFQVCAGGFLLWT